MGVIDNKKAYFDYEILEKLEAGIELLGLEVKSLRIGQGSLLGAYVIIRGREAFLVNANIPPYQINNTPKEYDPMRPRRLLLNSKELEKLSKLEKNAGLTIIPIMVYNKGGKIKLEIAIAKGKKKYDKRESIKKKDSEREVSRVLKSR